MQAPSFGNYSKCDEYENVVCCKSIARRLVDTV